MWSRGWGHSLQGRGGDWDGGHGDGDIVTGVGYGRWPSHPRAALYCEVTKYSTVNDHRFQCSTSEVTTLWRYTNLFIIIITKRSTQKFNLKSGKLKYMLVVDIFVKPTPSACCLPSAMIAWQALLSGIRKIWFTVKPQCTITHIARATLASTSLWQPVWTGTRKKHSSTHSQPL